MTTGYFVDVEYATPPLKRMDTFVVTSRAEARKIGVIGKEKGYVVTSYRPISILSAEEAVRRLDREVLESNRALNGETKNDRR